MGIESRPHKICKIQVERESREEEIGEMRSVGVTDRKEIIEQVDRDLRERKATKSDDAEVPVFLWTDHYLEEVSLGHLTKSERERVEDAMNTLRKYALRKWKRKVFHSYVDWLYRRTSTEEKRLMRAEEQRWIRWNKECGTYSWAKNGRHEYQRWYYNRRREDPFEVEAGSDAICRAWKSSWWEWDDGSRPFHWRWPEWYQSTIRDGMKVHLNGTIPRYTKPQRGVKDPKTQEAIKKKLSKVRDRRYIAKGTVSSLTSFFSVPKGKDDIRMVYDGTKSGLNDSMWVPRFGLPTVETHLRSIEEGTFMADVDVGECFLNFPLHHSLRPLAGVDLTRYFPESHRQIIWECWHRALMGAKSSPYQAVQGMSVAEEVIRGDPAVESNIFRWSSVRLNCPGDPHYDPSKPWVSKVREDGVIASDLVGYVDDLRPSGPSRQEAWKAARRTASILNHLGLQDAARKRRDSSQTPGAWAGSVVVTRKDGVFNTADTEKWLKAKSMVDEVLEDVQQDSTRMDRKRLEVIRGFLNYVVRTYPPLKAYLTGLHLTIDGWRSNRDAEGWKVKPPAAKKRKLDEDTRLEWDEDLDAEKGLFCHTEIDAPAAVEAKPRLKSDMEALRYLMSSPTPIPRRVRSTSGRKVIYCFGDASSSGFGITLEMDGRVYYEYGQWNEEVEGKSSNYRETKNLLQGLKRATRDHGLHGLEIFIFTDNTTAEATFWKGSSKNKDLSDLVLEMRKLEMENDLILHVIHVSGTRMIQQGTDGLSRADHSNGVMSGDSMTQHIPLDETAFQRSPPLLKRFKAHFLNLNLRMLEPRDWFDEHHRFGNFVWTPPPAAADAVVDLLNKARHKRPESMHVILIPRLMTGRWRRIMTRTADFYFKIDWDEVWNLKVHHEPLLCFVCLPFCMSHPRLGDRKLLLDEVDGVLLQSTLRQKGDGEKWNLLRKLFSRSRNLCPLPKRLL